jgi:hypothetical protein
MDTHLMRNTHRVEEKQTKNMEKVKMFMVHFG